MGAYRYPASRKAHVRKTEFFGEPCWVAGRPGYVYLMGDGWHFNTWEEAMGHATSTHEPGTMQAASTQGAENW